MVKAGDRIVFRGCMFDDGWEFDAPCILYSPFKRSGIGGNIGHIEDMVEDICNDLADGRSVPRGWSEGDLKEFRWRGWSPRGFARRRQAWHREIVVEFIEDDEWDTDLSWRPVSDCQWYGAHGKPDAPNTKEDA